MKKNLLIIIHPTFLSLPILYNVINVGKTPFSEVNLIVDVCQQTMYYLLTIVLLFYRIRLK